MKKLFVAILALGALASCQKENVPVVEEAKNKTIEINILNLVEETKATQGGDTAAGSNKLCAELGELKVLFCDANGTIKHEDFLSKEGTGDDTHDGNTDLNSNNYVKDEVYTDNTDDAKRRWHNVPATITKIAVVRYVAGEDFNKAENLVGLDLENDVLALANNQDENLARPIEKMVLCGWDTLQDTGKTHKVEDTVFHVWEANVNVAPAFARFEVRSIKCTNLGDANNKNLDGYTAATYGFDELLLKSLTLTYGGDEYTAPGFGTQRLYGSYDPLYAENQYDYVAGAPRGTNEYNPTYGAWSWNLTPDKKFNQLVLDIDAYAYDYKINYEEGKQDDRSFPLTVIGLASQEGGAADTSVFEAGSIYCIDLVFTESNIKDAEGICVDVVVTVNAWNVVPVYPVYGNN